MFLRAWRFGSALVLVCVCFSVVIEPAVGAPGDLDRSFGQNGVTELPFDPAKRVYANDVAAVPDGGLYVLRTFYEGGETRVERLRPDGSLDPAFGSNGSVAVPGSGRFAGGSSLAVTADDKAIVAGPDFLTRLHPDGSLDGSFGRGGFLMLGSRQSPADPIGGSDITGVAFAIQADGRIVAAVDRGREVANPALELSRYLPDGAPDPSFDGGAPIRTDVEKGQAGIALFGDGGLAVAGNPCCFQPGQARVLSLLADGSPDGAFGDAGLSPINEASEPVRVTAVIAQPDGKIIVAAAHENGPHGAFLLRFLANGKRDPSFGRRGLVSLGSDAPPAEILLDRRGRLTLVEALRTEPAVVGGSGLVTLARLTPNGSVDRTFGGGQPVRLFRLRSATAIGATFARKGRIAVLAQTGACIRECTPFHSYLAQYIGGSSSARCFGKRATIVGTARRDVLEGTPHRDVIAALGGDDTVRARGGNDLICGGRGDDQLIGGKGRDLLSSGAGHSRPHQ